jgi:excisionase family DNA binding protein
VTLELRAPDVDQLLEVAHAAKRLSVSHETIRRMIRRGTLHAIRLDSGHLRIDRRDLDAFINARRI